MSLGPPELVILLVIVVLLFGSTLLPRAARTAAETRRELARLRQTSADRS